VTDSGVEKPARKQLSHIAGWNGSDRDCSRWMVLVFGVHGLPRSCFLTGELMSSNEIARSFQNVEGSTMGASPWVGYSDKPDEMPLAGYATLLAAYGGMFGAVFGNLLSRSDVANPRPADVVMLGIATHKIGRIITKDWVTSPLRAPFVEYVESAGGGEVKERSRGTGLRRAVGDLLTCPWCIAPWVAGALYSLFLINPRAARLIASGFTSVAVSDFLQHAYTAARRAST